MKKLISLTLAIILSLSLFAATGFSQSDCGQECCCSSNMQGMQHATKYQAQFKGDCCEQAPAHPCGFAKKRNIELPMYTLSAGRINTGTAVGASLVISESPSVNKLILPQQRWPLAQFSILSSPIYLQHRSLLI